MATKTTGHQLACSLACVFLPMWLFVSVRHLDAADRCPSGLRGGEGKVMLFVPDGKTLASTSHILKSMKGH